MGEQEEKPKFKIGDAVVHPIRGAGRITGFKEVETEGTLRRYYTIRLLKQTTTNLMIPINEVDEIGLRAAVSTAEMDEVWTILASPPEELPNNYRARHKVIRSQSHTGNIQEIAKIIRDAGWRKQGENGLTQKGNELYKQGLRLLAAEIAAARDIPLIQAQKEIKAHLRASFERINQPNQVDNLEVAEQEQPLCNQATQ